MFKYICLFALLMGSLEVNYQYFLDANLAQYIGEWVAIYEGKVIAHAKDVRIVAKEAQKICGNKKFLLSRVPSEETMIF